MANNQGWQEVKAYCEDWQVIIRDQSWQNQMVYDAGGQDVTGYDKQSWQVMFYDQGLQEAVVFDDD